MRLEIPFRAVRFLAAFSLLTTSCRAAPATTPGAPQAPGEWRTAFYKRGFVGVYQAGWASGVNSTIRLRVPIQFEGTKVRVTLAHMRDGETVLSKMTLVKGKDNSGAIDGAPQPLLFNGAPGVSIAANAPDVVSDAADVPVTRGIWYLQESYSSEKYLYAYHNDGFFNEAGDKHDAPTLGELKKGVWPGNVTRVEVFTTDTRPTILCYGDSITHGYNSTPGAGKSYPEVLGQLTKLPTLNLGVNSDVITYAGGAPALINTFNGVHTVIVLMGINDIISGRIKDVDGYAKVATGLISSLKHNGKRVIIGTLPPAGGHPGFDKDPANETLRQGINEWIKTKSAAGGEASGADAVINFDVALGDPADRSRMKAEYQSDWLHPNDAGYAKMAEAAAGLIGALSPMESSSGKPSAKIPTKDAPKGAFAPKTVPAN